MKQHPLERSLQNLRSNLRILNHPLRQVAYEVRLVRGHISELRQLSLESCLALLPTLQVSVRGPSLEASDVEHVRVY